jgi:serine protease inhibitor
MARGPGHPAEPIGNSWRPKGMRLRTRTSLGLLAAACLTAAVAGCGSATSTPAKLDVAIARGTAMTEPAVSPRPLAAADTAFGLDVMRAWCAQNQGQNLVFSPSTLASALGLAYLGARGATATAMAHALDLPAGASRETLEAELQARIKALGRLDGPGVTLAASDQVWADPTLVTLRSYLNAVATGYDAGVAKAPFSTDATKAADEINQAISAATRGHISQLVSPGMVQDVGWVLTSALYLNAKWATPFDPTMTQALPFAAAGGKSVTAKFMNNAGFPYASSDGWQAVSLPYQGGKVTMTALLPPSGSGSCALPSQAALSAMTSTLDSPRAENANVWLPKVNLDTSGGVGDMAPTLKKLGMGVAFGEQADFTGLSPEAAYIGFVQQAATLQVGEKGTVGAAAAAVGIVASAGRAPIKAVNVTFNRPYLMLITAEETGEPLFLAEVDNPLAS